MAVTTGPVTVPFIMALGVGLASIRGDSGAQEDSFGLVALCSIGPVLAVLLLGIFYPTNGAGYTAVTVPDVEDTRQAAHICGGAARVHTRGFVRTGASHPVLRGVSADFP